MKAAVHCRGLGVQFLVAELPGIPFLTGRFDAVVSADCICEFVPDDKKDEAVREIFSALKDGGTAVFSDYIKPERFSFFENLVKRHFQTVTVHYLHDRLWYQFESWFKAVRRWRWVQEILASVKLARGLSAIAKLFGKRGSCHVMIVAQKQKSEI